MLSELRVFNKVISQIDGAYHEFALKMGLSDSELHILYTLLNEGSGCNQSALYLKSGFGKTTINSAIRRLEKQGVLYLESGEGRNTRVFLTEKGEALSANTAGKLAQIEEAIFLSWPARERKRFAEMSLRYLDQFLKNIRAMEE